MPDYSKPSYPSSYNQRLRNHDPALYFVWNAPKRIWEIWWKNPKNGKRQRCLKIGNGYDYQPLDERVFKILERGDSWKIGIKEIIRQVEAEEDAYEAAQEKARNELSKNIAEDCINSAVLRQKPIGIATEKEHQKSSGIIIG